MGGGEILQQPLSDEADLDMAIVGGQLATDSGAIAVGLTVQVLRAAVARDALHAAHPEVIVVGAETPQRLLEGQLDLEAQSIAADDIDGRESQVRGEEDAAAAGRMIDEDEADYAPQRSPEQIPGQESHSHAALAVDRTFHLLPQIGWGIEQGPQFDLAAIEARPAAPPWADGSGERFKGDRVATQPRDQGAAPRQSPVGHCGAGVIGVGDHDEWFGDAQRIGEGTEFLGQGAMIAITELHSLVDASRERNG